MKQVSLITPTGARPEAFRLCEQWVSKFQGHWQLKEWLVVDDYPTIRTRLTKAQVRIKAPKEWTPEINTQRYNMDALLERITGEYIFIIEDDEYYAPNYIEEMLKLLDFADVVGLANSKYYHLKVPGFKYMGNFEHASLCQTAITKKALPFLYRAVHSGRYYFDIELWKLAKQEKLKTLLLSNTNLSIGIKGMPGRAGLGSGHERVGYRADDEYKIFKEWLGKDWEFYKEYLK